MMWPLTPENADKIAAAGAFYAAIYTFVITIVVLLLTVIALYFTLRQGADLKRSEINLKQSENERVQFDSAFRLLTLIGAPNRTSGTFAELAAIKELQNYPKYFSVYEYMLYHFKSFPDADDVDRYIAATEQLVDKTRPRP